MPDNAQNSHLIPPTGAGDGSARGANEIGTFRRAAASVGNEIV
jgi:hypothetical protein